MSVDALLAAMFPGDPACKIPGFAALGLDTGAMAISEAAQVVGRALADLPQTGTAEVNEILRALRKSHPEAAQAFIDAALAAYFTAPEVIRALRGGPETLFPHARMLPDIDYALLEPVFERGSPRDQNERK
ncbi:hypothetical protein [Rhodopseudomonas palustris]|uniref:hypothetical protein n=1 Tax=Rhodopseudomonas palustris TaxID=1076 RepID=UPI0021F268AA|nr:hypothetical protein [Rhodopseudomonas palustris]UYO53627.1 hypothetical protein KQX61_24115 [Rhodopseudomonas palustris]